MASSPLTFSFADRRFDAASGAAYFSYEISGKENFKFTEKVVFPFGFKEYDAEAFERALDTLTLILGISYWKLFCPTKIEVKFTTLSKAQADFWNNLYTKGLGEFFYQNKIDFRGLVQFPFSEKATLAPSEKKAPTNRALLLVGGGKDSIVSYELAKKSGVELTQFVVNSDRIKEEVMNIAGAPRLIAKRELDPQIFKLVVRPDVYKGHVPATAIVQAIALCTSILHRFDYVVASNEESASYGNVSYLGEEINHQWSKSLEYEKLWQNYVGEFVTPSVTAFSLLRPLSEIKIIEIFAKHSEYFAAFSSCNKNFTIKDKQSVRWCCECPKCAFVFAGLAAFLPKEKVIGIFGENLFAKKELIPLYRELLGLEKIKPFECVGTPEEVKLMLWLASERGEFSARKIRVDGAPIDVNYSGDAVMNMFECDCKDMIPEIKKSQQKLLAVGSLETLPEKFLPSYEN